MILEAAHEQVRAHTIGTQELGAVGTSGHRLLLGLATGALEQLLLDRDHVKHVVHYVIVLQVVNAFINLK